MNLIREERDGSSGRLEHAIRYDAANHVQKHDDERRQAKSRVHWGKVRVFSHNLRPDDQAECRKHRHGADHLHDNVQREPPFMGLYFSY